ncbi:VOC family protein [Streptomyces sp. NPDC001922]|uniref:VOC family protein n=1 Tax=Streptomyces sp. NPDC001922 TaxID=3364624 RepID=UPI0036D203E3
MTEAETHHRPGTPCWVSLMVHSLTATQDFYSSLFGWTFSPGPPQLGPYAQALLGGRVVAGIGVLPPDRELPVAWTTYLATEDTHATAYRIRCCGGTVGVGPLDAGAAGRLVIAADPTGAVFGAWQSREHRGTEAAGDPGTPVRSELFTRESGTAAKFYAAVFGFEPAADGPDRHALLLDGRPVAAVHGLGAALPRERGPYWMTSFAVADADAAARRVTELGGRVVRPPGDGAAGRSAEVADPEGAVFTVLAARS